MGQDADLLAQPGGSGVCVLTQAEEVSSGPLHEAEGFKFDPPSVFGDRNCAIPEVSDCAFSTELIKLQKQNRSC